MKKSRSGFTLVEMIIVVVVIAILATIVAVSYNGIQARSRDAQRKTDIANIMKAMELYYSDKGSYPLPTTRPTGSRYAGDWYTTGDASWTDVLSSLLTGTEAIDVLPSDPRVTTSSTAPSGGLGYAVYVNQGTYCGAGPGQMYLIVWRYESSAKERKTDGNCTTNPIGDEFYNSGASYYRMVRHGS